MAALAILSHLPQSQVVQTNILWWREGFHLACLKHRVSQSLSSLLDSESQPTTWREVSSKETSLHPACLKHRVSQSLSWMVNHYLHVNSISNSQLSGGDPQDCDIVFREVLPMEVMQGPRSRRPGVSLTLSLTLGGTGYGILASNTGFLF